MNTTKSNQLTKGFELKPYSIKELTHLYGVTWHVFHKWILAIQHKLGPQIGRLYTIQQVQIIVKAFGIPGQVVNEEGETVPKKAA